MACATDGRGVREARPRQTTKTIVCLTWAEHTRGESGDSVVKDQQQLTGEGRRFWVDLFLQIVKIRFAADHLSEGLALFRRVGSRGEFRFHLGAGGLEALEFFGDLANGALEAVDHSADAVEQWGLGFEGIAQGGSILHRSVPDLSFGILKTVETPKGGGELVDALLLGHLLGTPCVQLKFFEGFEFLGIFAGNDERLGMNAVFDSVVANGGFRLGRGRPGGQERIGAIGVYLGW